MAQGLGVYAPAYKVEDLKVGRFQAAFSGQPHEVYFVYDEAVDQFIVRLVNPSIRVSEYAILDDVALLVRDDNREVVGFSISEFEAGFLRAHPKLLAMWTEFDLAVHLRTYRKTRYDPKLPRAAPPAAEQRIVQASAFQSRMAMAMA